MKKILEEYFGYPNNFARAEWMARKDEIWEITIMEVEDEYGGV